MYSPSTPNKQHSPSMLQTNNQDLHVQEAENDATGNLQRMTGQSEKEHLSNVHQKADSIPQEDGIPPLQLRDLQVFDQSSSSDTQKNFGHLTMPQKEEKPRNVFNPANIHPSPQQVMNADVSNGPMSPRHQENIFHPDDIPEEPIADELQNSTPIVNETSQRDESSSEPIQNQTDQSKRLGVKRPIDDTPDDERYKAFHSITDIDTQQLCQSMYKKLNDLVIHQAVFAEKVLQRTQGTLSDLLRFPKPWNEMIKQGQDTYRRMYMFLMIPDEDKKKIKDMSVDEVQQMMNFPPATKKKRRTGQAGGSNPDVKMGRQLFDARQKGILTAIFNENSRPSSEVIEQISKTLEISITSVNNFFQNSRKREKQNKTH